MFRQVSWLFAMLFGVALAGATTMNLVLISQARQALDEGILGTPSTKPAPQQLLALVIPDTNDSFFQGLEAGAREKAEVSKVAIQIFRYRADNEQEAEAYFQLCLTSHVDGIVFFAGSDVQQARRRSEAQAENVVFIPVGTHAPGSGGGFIGSSSLLQGIESGNQLGLRKGRNAKIGILLSSEGEGAPENDPVYQGVAAALRTYQPGAQIVRAVRARPGILSGEEAASALLRSDPSINVLVCASAPITEGAAQVVVDLGRVGQVLIIGTDESPTIDRLVDKGVIAASVVRDSRKMGSVALDVFLAAREGRPFNAIEVGFSVRTRQAQP